MLPPSELEQLSCSLDPLLPPLPAMLPSVLGTLPLSLVAVFRLPPVLELKVGLFRLLLPQVVRTTALLSS